MKNCNIMQKGEPFLDLMKSRFEKIEIHVIGLVWTNSYFKSMVIDLLEFTLKAQFRNFGNDNSNLGLLEKP